MKNTEITYKSINWENGEEITTPDISKLLEQYLKNEKLDQLNFQTSLQKAEKLFAAISKDYLAKKITLEEYSALGHYFFHHKGKQHQNATLFDASLAASELLFASQNKANDLSDFLSDINLLVQKYE